MPRRCSPSISKVPMSLMSFLFPKSNRTRLAHSEPAHTGMHRKTPRGVPAATAETESIRRRAARAARRELLYAVVRETMVRAGVLSASYKFKVLSIDGDGLQYLVMIDLGRDAQSNPAQFPEIEALIAQSAKARHQILVSAVYWRLSEHVAVGRATGGHTASGPESQPMADSIPAPMHSGPAPLVAAVAPFARGAAYEPIQADEVVAFKRALMTGSSRPAPLTPTPDAPRKAGVAEVGDHSQRSYTLLTGYEETELPDDPKAPVLSGTQYGELR